MKEEKEYEFIECINREKEDALKKILSCEIYLLTCINANLQLMEKEYEDKENS